jgi:hypothetical protein
VVYTAIASIQLNEQPTWQQAKTAAEAKELLPDSGIHGYLANSTIQQELDFVAPRLNAEAWIGGTDAAVEGDWRWSGGPENGQLFYQGTGASGSAQNGLFNYWETVEPNEFCPGEDCMQILGNNFKWNDMPCDTPFGQYIVEYSATTSP